MIQLKAGNYLGKAEQIIRVNGLIASVTKYPDVSYSENLHSHDTLHMSLVLNGGNLERRKYKDIIRQPGVVTFYDAGELHQSTRTAPGSRHINLEIEDNFLRTHGLSIDAGRLNNYDEMVPPVALQRIFAEMCIGGDDTFIAIESGVLAMLHPATRKHNKAKPRWANVVKHLLMDRWNHTIGLNELAAVAGVHPVTISKHFHHYFGCTLGEYRRIVKVNRALQMMQFSSLSLTSIAMECGFSDQSHFNRAFKQIIGVSPYVFRSF